MPAAASPQRPRCARSQGGSIRLLPGRRAPGDRVEQLGRLHRVARVPDISGRLAETGGMTRTRSPASCTGWRRREPPTTRPGSRSHQWLEQPSRPTTTISTRRRSRNEADRQRRPTEEKKSAGFARPKACAKRIAAGRPSIRWSSRGEQCDGDHRLHVEERVRPCARSEVAGDLADQPEHQAGAEDPHPVEQRVGQLVNRRGGRRRTGWW